MSEMPIILTFVRCYLPGYKFGGPVRSISNMVEHLNNELSFLVITSDRDAFDSKAYSNVSINSWNTVDKAKVYYTSKQKCSFWSFVRLIKETPHDVIYLNSFFDPVFTILPLLARALGIIPSKSFVLAPRGEFSEGALALKSWKKKPYLWFSRISGLYRDITWQASSEHEAQDIRRALGQIVKRMVVAPNLPSSIDTNTPKKFELSTDGTLRVVFLSRITPKKNLDFALRVLAQVKVPVKFYIYGPVWEKEYWQNCLELINDLPDNITVYYQGSVSPESVPEVMAAYDLFFFPTRGENFGHVILEALSAGTPVLISDRTPWVDDCKGGCIVRSLDDTRGYVEMIEKITYYSVYERKRMQEAAKALAKSIVNKNDLVEKNLLLFQEACSNI